MAENEIKKGLAGVVVDYTAVSKVNPDTNSLLYRGYPVQELAARCSRCRPKAKARQPTDQGSSTWPENSRPAKTRTFLTHWRGRSALITPVKRFFGGPRVDAGASSVTARLLHPVL